MARRSRFHGVHLRRLGASVEVVAGIKLMYTIPLPWRIRVGFAEGVSFVSRVPALETSNLARNPTAQNLANFEADMRVFAPTIAHESAETITHLLEMLVRAYDPCISCSTHVIDRK